MKHKLKVKYYIRYADDFVILSDKKDELDHLLILISDFLQTKLKLSLHPNKVFIKTFSSGVEFLGWVHFPHQTILKTKTKWRMFKKLEESQKKEVLASYLGMLSHGNCYRLKQKIADGFLHPMAR
jgi:hypothetical protein